MNQIEYVKGVPSDYEAIVDLGNYVFSHEYTSTDFPTLLPKVYGKDINTAKYHYLAKVDGKLVAMIGAIPCEMDIMGRHFKGCGIGTVCVHPYFRGLGLMKMLLNHAVADMKREGLAFGTLSGQRQRYEYFGFEPCGTSINFSITSNNIRHCFRGKTFKKISFAPLKLTDNTNICKSIDLQQNLPLYFMREPSNFYVTCCSWNSRPYVILLDNRYVGYMICSNDKGSILEMELSDTALLPDVIAAFFPWSGVNSIHFNLPPYDREKIKILETFCDGLNVSSVHSFNIFDYENMIRQLLLLKASYTKLEDGRLVLEIENNIKLAIEVRSQKVSVEKTSEQADITLPHLKAMRFLFSPLSAFFNYAREYGKFVASWFPLPLYIPRADDV
jgi:predicted N-acetyltransferase YhbS